MLNTVDIMISSLSPLGKFLGVFLSSGLSFLHPSGVKLIFARAHIGLVVAFKGSRSSYIYTVLKLHSAL